MTTLQTGNAVAQAAGQTTKHQAYGLTIESEVALPELPFADGAPDLLVRLGPEAAPNETSAARPQLRVISQSELCLQAPGAADYWLREGREIVIEPRPGVDARLLRLHLLGPALAVLLHQRGGLVQHASAVTLRGTPGQAAAFLGASGWGKSTMAGALVQRGHALVADDFIALPAAAAEPRVYPGFPQLKLWPEAAESLGENAAELPRVHPALAKRGHRLAQGFAAEPAAVRALYVLAEGEPIAAQPLTGQAALIELVRHSFLARALPRLGAAAHFQQCARLLQSVPLFRLERPRSLKALPAVAAYVETHFSQVVEGRWSTRQKPG